MPHVVVKLWPGKSQQQKKQLAQGITDSVMSVLDSGEESGSVAFEEIDPGTGSKRSIGPRCGRRLSPASASNRPAAASKAQYP